MSYYSHLNRYPYLLRFCQENQIPIAPYEHTRDQLILRDIVANPILHLSEEHFDLRRAVINSCLQLGYNNGVMTAYQVSRLKGNDPVQFWSSVSELKVGVWIQEQGIQIIEFEPPSAGVGKGDFLIKNQDQEVFIEVKTLFGESEMFQQEKVTSDIAKYCEVNHLPAEIVNLEHLSADYDYANNKCTLLKAIGQLINKYIPITEKRLIHFNENSGIEIDIELNPKASRVISRMYGGSSGLADDLMVKLDVGIVGNRRLQTSANGIPSICIIDDFAYNIDEIIIESVLYGNLVEDHTKPPNVTYYRESGGKWSGQNPSDLSSVFVLKFIPNTTNVRTLDAYLCPNSKYELDRAIFLNSNMTWRILDKNFIHVKTLNK